jgi:hypothetical protein
MNSSPPTSQPRSRVGQAFAGVNALFWVALILFTPPTLSLFADREPPFSFSGSGLRINVCHDCEPLLVLAGRAFDPGGFDDPMRWALIANLPGALVAGLVVMFSEAIVGTLAAMCLQTLTFFLVSSGQWWALGWVIERIGRQLLGSRHP